jgi:hypothetical protein
MWLARIGWILAGACVLALFLVRRHWWPWVLLPVLIVVPVLWWTADWEAALAGFLSIGLTVLGALAFGRHWWPAYVLLATVVALLLLLAPDAYTMFGITFDLALLALLAARVVSSTAGEDIRNDTIFFQ